MRKQIIWHTGFTRWTDHSPSRFWIHLPPGYDERTKIVRHTATLIVSHPTMGPREFAVDVTGESYIDA